MQIQSAFNRILIQNKLAGISSLWGVSPTQWQLGYPRAVNQTYVHHLHHGGATDDLGRKGIDLDHSEMTFLALLEGEVKSQQLARLVLLKGRRP